MGWEMVERRVGDWMDNRMGRGVDDKDRWSSGDEMDSKLVVGCVE